MSVLGFLGLGLFIIGILFAAYVVTHLDQIWNIFENIFGKIENYTEKMSVIPPANASLFGSSELAFAKENNITKYCTDFVPYHWEGHTCQTMFNTIEIIKQNKVIIQQNLQILKNQEVLKCYAIQKIAYGYDVGDSVQPFIVSGSLTSKDLIEVCGK